jgi:hypothetical protein
MLSPQHEATVGRPLPSRELRAQAGAADLWLAWRRPLGTVQAGQLPHGPSDPLFGWPAHLGDRSAGANAAGRVIETPAIRGRCDSSAMVAPTASADPTAVSRWVARRHDAARSRQAATGGWMDLAGQRLGSIFGVRGDRPRRRVIPARSPHGCKHTARSMVWNRRFSGGHATWHLMVLAQARFGSSRGEVPVGQGVPALIRWCRTSTSSHRS